MSSLWRPIQLSTESLSNDIGSVINSAEHTSTLKCVKPEKKKQESGKRSEKVDDGLRAASYASVSWKAINTVLYTLAAFSGINMASTSAKTTL